MAVRVGKGPSEDAWAFFNDCLNRAWERWDDLKEIIPPENNTLAERFRRFLRYQVLPEYNPLPILIFAFFALPFILVIVFFLNIELMNQGFAGVLMLLGLLAAGAIWFYVMKRVVSEPGFVGSQFNRARGVVTNPLVKQARRGTFNGIAQIPYAKRYAEALYVRERRGLELENRLPLEMEIAHEILLEPGRKSNVINVYENEIRAVGPLAVSCLNMNRWPPAKQDLFFRSMLEMARQNKKLPAGHVISTRGGVVVADVKYWDGVLQKNKRGHFVDMALGAEELSRHRSINALAESARFINGGDIALVLVIVTGGQVEGGKLEDRMKGFPVVVAEWDEAIEALLLLDAKRTTPTAKSINEVMADTPEAVE